MTGPPKQFVIGMDSLDTPFTVVVVAALGPFPDKQLAVTALKRYIRELKDSDNRLTTSSG